MSQLPKNKESSVPKLSKMMYVLSPLVEQPFGLSRAQMRCPFTVQNAGWFNGSGERIGYGDLGIDDIRRISAEIDTFEVFLVLEEWEHIYHVPKDLDWEAPGLDFILAKTHMVIVQGLRILVEKRKPVTQAATMLDGLEFQLATPQQASEFVHGFLALRAPATTT